MRYEGLLTDGRPIVFRPLRPEDKETIRRGFEELSPESRYRRFFRRIDHLNEEQLRFLTELDFVNHFAWLAYLPEEPGFQGAGVARWIRVPGEPDVAEGAVTVIDSLHGKGIGTTLLWLAARSAIEKGIKAFRVVVQGENHPVLALLHGLGVKPDHWESGVAEIDVPLPVSPEDLAVTPTTLLLKAVAEGRFHGEAAGTTRFGTRFLSKNRGEEGERKRKRP